MAIAMCPWSHRLPSERRMIRSPTISPKGWSSLRMKLIASSLGRLSLGSMAPSDQRRGASIEDHNRTVCHSRMVVERSPPLWVMPTVMGCQWPMGGVAWR